MSDEFIEFIKNNNVTGIANPVSDTYKISIQDLRILWEAFTNPS